MPGITRARVVVGICTAIAAINFSAASLISQTPAAKGQAILQSEATPVLLDLGVRDRHRKPVLDLRPEEVSVADNGAPAKLTSLRLVNGDKQHVPLVTLLFDRPGIEGSGRILEDSQFGISASTARETGKRLSLSASNFLKSFPAGNFQFAVVDVWGRLQIQQEFSANRKATEESVVTAVEPGAYGAAVEANPVERYLMQVAKTGRDSSGFPARMQDSTLAVYAAMQTSSRIGKEQHLSPSQACLLALVEMQQSLPGRKAIVYFTSLERGRGDPYYRLDSSNDANDGFKSIVGAANRAGVSIFIVLTDALQNTRDFMANMRSADQVGGIEQLNMTMLATQTGGDVLNGSRRINGQVKDMARSLTSYYEVYFAPPAGVEDGTFHTAAFKISREGLRMRAPAGYLATPTSARIVDPLQPFEVPLMALVNRQQRPDEVGYRARVLQMEHGDEGNVDLLALEVPVSGLEVRTDTSTHLSSAHVSVLAIIIDSAGTQIERFGEDIARRWSTESNSGTAPAFIAFERSFAAPPGTYILETAILDNNSGKAAVKEQTFEVAASHLVPEMSDLMVVRGTEPAENGTTEPDLLWHSEQRVLPNLYEELPAGEHSISVFFVAHADPNSQAQATVKLEVLRDGTPLKGKPPTLTLKAGEEFSAVMTTFSISSGADGKYEVRASLTQGDKSAEKTTEFKLIGQERHIVLSSTAPVPDPVVADDLPLLGAAEQKADRPTQEELDQVLADARKNALDYGDELPNLICHILTQRYDARGKSDWRLKDTFVEELTYINQKETRTLIGRQTVSGEVSYNRVSSTGEFGSSLANIFKSESKAKFTWRETSSLRGEPTEVFDYRVNKENSLFGLIALPKESDVAYHGRIYINQATHAVKSITIITDEQPKNFLIRKVAIRVDYDYVAINDHDYLLPVSAQLVTKLRGTIGDQLRRNDLTFSNFHKFGSTARIMGPETAKGSPDEPVKPLLLDTTK
jgi:VWFA-related protein